MPWMPIEKFPLTCLSENASGTMNLGDLVMFPDGRDDPYLREEAAGLDDDASDVEDLTIKPDDNLVLVGHQEGDKATLEVYGRALP